MKNSLNYLDLWQKKRNELPVSDEPKQDWLAMQALLNTHLPNPLVKHTLGSKAVKVIKGLKTWSVLSIALPAAALVCVLTYIYVIKPKHHHPKKEPKKHGIVINKDTILNIIPADSLNILDSTSSLKDSILYKTHSIPTVNPSKNSRDSSSLGQESAGVINPNNPNNRSTLAAVNNTHTNNPLTNNKNNRSGAGGLIKHPGSNTLYSRNNRAGRSGLSYIGNKGQAGNAGRNSSLKGNSISPLSDSDKYRSGNSANKTLVLASNTHIIQQLIWSADSTQNDLNGFFTIPSLSTFSDGANNNRNTSIIEMIIKGNKKPATLSSIKNIKDKNTKGKKSKSIKNQTSILSNIDYGILAGINTSNSFTPKAQNKNLYGSAPVDFYLGVFGTYNFNSKWAVNLQVKGLNPQKLNGTYTHTNQAKADTGKKDSVEALKITDSRKAYFVNIPVHLVYKINNYFSVKAGPVINIPVKQINGITAFTPQSIKTDTPYYTKVNGQVNATRYVPKINLGFSGGIGLQYKRFSLEAVYLKSFSGYTVKSDLGNYKSNPGSLQISIGFQLNKPKK